MSEHPDSPLVRLDTALRSCPVMAVFRGLAPAETVRRAEIAWNLGVVAVEVPIESPTAVHSLAAAVQAGRDQGRDVGAGTITTASQLTTAIEAGAAYGVSPGLDPVLLKHATEAGFPMIPGVATASEILAARSLGFRWIKAFPASVLGPQWIRAMKGPFPDLEVIVTGGVDAHNAAAFLESGASVVGVGSAFDDDAQRDILRSMIAAHSRSDRA